MASSKKIRPQEYPPAGLRVVEIWVLDIRQEGFPDECRRQSLAIANDPHEKDIQGWLESISDTKDWA